MTVHKGGIEKYLEPAMAMVKKYDLDQYYIDRLQLVKEEIDGLFLEDKKEELTKQFSLTDFMRTLPK